MSKTIYIGGRLESKEKGNVVAGANAILDDTKGKMQNVINKETDDELLRLEQSKQENLTFDNVPTEDSTNPVTSGGVYTAEKALSDAIEAILLLIPSAATALNKLVDTNTMNSSISTATATFRGTYNAVSDLGLTYQATHAQIEAALDALGLTADNNDFAFVQIPVSDQSQDIAKTERYKNNGINWLYEYDLNTSGFTAAQWAAINSTITLALVQKLAALPTNAELLQALGLKQDVLTFDNAPTTDSNNPVKSGGIKNAIDTAVGDETTARENADTALAGLIGDEKTRAEGVEGGLNTRLGAVEGSVTTIQGVIPSEATSSNKLVDNNSMTTYIGTIIDNIDATFNVTSTDGHVTLAITQVNGVITSVQLTTSDIASAAALNLKASQADLTALAGRVTTAEGNITSLTGRVSTNETDIATLLALYNALQQSDPDIIEPSDTWPVANPSGSVIYRVIDRVNTPPEYYSDYMWNGTSMVLMATYNNAVDTTPKKDSANLITSGGVFANIGAFDISEYHKSGGTLVTYADLSAALAAIPSDYQKGGMSIKFVQSSDNKYMQYRLITEDFSTNEEDWQSVNEYIKESKRYVFALVDNDDKMVFGITKDGKFVCQDDFLSLALANPLSLKVNISDIVDNLTTQSVNVPLSAKQGYVLKELIDALNTTLSGEITTLDNRVSAIEANYTFITNDRYLIAIVDADEKVLWGIKKDGKLDEPTRLEESLNWLFVLTDNNGSVVFGIKKDGSVYAPGLTITNYDEEIAELQGDIENIQGDIVELQEAIENFEVPDDTVEIAIGKQRSYGTYQSELDASPFVDSAIEQNIGYKTIHKNTVLTTINKKMIVMNHDDGSLPDIIGTRKIYNKYGFKGSFCCVFTHFSTLSAAKKIITNMRKLIKEGHAVGLHAIMNASYWYANRIYDVTPDGSSNFAPLLSEIQGDNPDGTGINTFGDTITVDTLASDVYYMTPTAELIPELNVKVVDLTQSQVDRLNRQYCLYSDEYATTGIDDLALTDIMSATSANSLTKTRIQWLEYYYNGLVDNTLGYSSTASTIAQKFAEDYNVPSGANAIDYYPDASHLKNGKMVYWNDTTNSHYADAKVKTASGFSEDDYQFVGKFTKGLYKDCFSTMNFEVMDRCVAIAEAFFRKYHGLNHFAEFHIHGIHYLNWYYQNTDGSIYSDREKEMIYYPLAKWYSSRKKAFVSVADIMSEYGMNFVKDGLRRQFVTWFGSEGFYYKVDGVRNVTDDFNNNFEDYYASSVTQYLAAFGTTDTGMSTMSYTTFNTFMQGVDNWLKYFYDNAGATNVSRNGISGINIYSYLKNVLEKILGSVGSGRVPVISVDTIANSPGVLVAVEVLFRFLKAVGFEVVSLEEGRQRVLSVGRDSNGNLFPNPSFERTLLDYFGGSSTQKDAYKPDGWMGNSWGNVTYDVTKGTVGENQNVPILSINGGTWLYTSAWGLPAGSYKLSFWAKGSNAVSILTGLIKNSTNINNAFDSTKEDNCIIDTYNPASTSEWSEHVVNITIPDFHRNTIDADDFYNVVCDGYEDNVCAIALRINVASNSYRLDFSCPKLYKINN